MKRLHLACLLAALLPVVSLPTASRGEELRWRDWNSGLKEASSTKRPILVDVYTDWCGWCKRMDRDVYARSDVRDYLTRRFVTIKLNAEASQAANYEGKAYSSRALASRFRVTGYPTTIFLRAQGEHVANVPGYVPADRFLLLLRYIGDGHLDRGVPFEDFARKERAAN
jgi:thioredoxin-related protein